MKASRTAAISIFFFRFLMYYYLFCSNPGHPEWSGVPYLLQAMPVVSVIVLEVFLFRISFVLILFPGFRMLFIVFFFPGFQLLLALGLLFLFWLFPLVFVLVGLVFLYFGSLLVILFILGTLSIVIFKLWRLALLCFHFWRLAIVSGRNGRRNKGASHEGEGCQDAVRRMFIFFMITSILQGNLPALCFILIV